MLSLPPPPCSSVVKQNSQHDRRKLSSSFFPGWGAKVSREMLPFLGECFGNPSSAHVLGRACKSTVDKARARVATMLGCLPGELVFVASGSEADNHAILGAVSYYLWSVGSFFFLLFCWPMFRILRQACRQVGNGGNCVFVSFEMSD